VSARGALERVTKWRTLLAGWQTGSRPKGDPECDAIRDHRELSIILRVEGSALVGLLIAKGIIAQAEWEQALEREANLLSLDYEKRFPGVKATGHGLTIDAERVAKLGWMKSWKP
jgi:hypothetical protein